MEPDPLSLIGIIGALLTVFIKLFEVVGSWQKTRQTDQRLEKEIEHTLKEVQFIDQWLTTVAKSTSGDELENRKTGALSHLDALMLTYLSYRQDQKQEQAPRKSKNRNGWFYAMSAFMVLLIIGLFVDDDGDFSLIYFEQNTDGETLLGLGFFVAIWVYFLINSSFVKSKAD